MQDNHRSRDRDTATAAEPLSLEAKRLAKLQRLADDYALVLSLELGPQGLGYVLRDHWTGVVDFGPATAPEIARHLRHYQDMREQEHAEGWTP